jgi:hypothetical protein
MDRLIVGRLIFADLRAPITIGENPSFDRHGFEMEFDEQFRLHIPRQSMTETASLAFALCPDAHRAHFIFEAIRCTIAQAFPRDDHLVDEVEDLIVVMRVIP